MSAALFEATVSNLEENDSLQTVFQSMVTLAFDELKLEPPSLLSGPNAMAQLMMQVCCLCRSCLAILCKHDLLCVAVCFDSICQRSVCSPAF
jgi:hypothetical protein